MDYHASVKTIKISPHQYFGLVTHVHECLQGIHSETVILWSVVVCWWHVSTWHTCLVNHIIFLFSFCQDLWKYHWLLCWRTTSREGWTEKWRLCWWSILSLWHTVQQLAQNFQGSKSEEPYGVATGWCKGKCCVLKSKFFIISIHFTLRTSLK